MDSGGVIVEQKGPNGWSIVGAGAFVGIALVIIGLALFSLAQWAGIAVIIVAVGYAGLNFCRGAALIIEARGRARAMIGPRAAEDMRALWGPSADE